MIPTLANTEIAWKPHDGPQMRFHRLSAFEALYGGAAGGGKSDSLLVEALRYVHIRGYRALLCRASYPELQELMDRARDLYPRLRGSENKQEKRWTFPSGAIIAFAYIDTFADACDHDGKQYHYLGFDELGKCREERTWTRLLSRLRMPPDGVVLRARASANPGGAGHAWVKRRFVDPCGPLGDKLYEFELEPGQSVARAYVPARVTDNPTLMARDPGYAARLRMLPEVERRALLEGDWDAGEGLALPELNALRHFMPKDWKPAYHFARFLSFDWGHSHPFSLGIYCVPRDGQLVKLDTITGRKMNDSALYDYCRSALIARGYGSEERRVSPFDSFEYTVAGSDCFGHYEARVGSTPSTAERFAQGGWYLTGAHDKAGSRLANLSTARHYTTGPEPRFRFADTAGNRKCFAQMAGIVMDPDKPEQSLKVDADASGDGGDDMWDETLYAMASRPLANAEPVVTDYGRESLRDPDLDRSITEANELEENPEYVNGGGLPWGF